MFTIQQTGRLVFGVRQNPGWAALLVCCVGALLGNTRALHAETLPYAWGRNSSGQLGDGTTTDRSTPVQVTGLSGATGISAGESHSLALKNDGTVWAWGSNGFAQLGDGTTTGRSTPVQVTGLSGVTAIAAGRYHSVALRNDGTVWAWGSNGSGQLGDGTTTDRWTPVQVTGLSGVTAVTTVWDHSLALKNDGAVWAWGDNLFGQLGDGTTTNRSTPVQVTGLSGVTVIAGGAYHSLTLKNDGTVWAWGNNQYGQLGNGTYTNRWTPVQVTGLSGIAAIAGGNSHSLALMGVLTTALPTFSPAEGTYGSAQSVAISCATTGATIYYTTDGSVPSGSSAQYSSPITVSTTTTIKAFAVATGMADSAVVTATYTIGSGGGGGGGGSNSNLDSDGDGFANEIEDALLTSSTDASATPFGGAPAGTPLPLALSKLRISLNFAPAGGKDAVSLIGTLPVPAGFVVAGQRVTLDVGGVVKDFVLDAKGSSPKGQTSSFKLRVKAEKGVVAAQNAKFTAKLSKGTFASLLADEGLTNTTIKAALRAVPVVILFNQALYRVDQWQAYAATAGKTGRTKAPR